jgi:hypothetical protein
MLKESAEHNNMKKRRIILLNNLKRSSCLLHHACFSTSNSSKDSWLIDSGWTNHMTNNQDLFKELDRIAIFKVKIGNGNYIDVKDK